MRAASNNDFRDLNPYIDASFCSSCGVCEMYLSLIHISILVKNAPSYAALGFGGEGYCTFTIASRTGEGLTDVYKRQKQYSRVRKRG